VRNYLDLVGRILSDGQLREDRTGFGTLSLFGEQLKFDLVAEFPATTAKRLAFKQVCAELACFLRGYDNLEDFHKMGCTVWDANENHHKWKSSSLRRGQGDLGLIYGVQWRRWGEQHLAAYEQSGPGPHGRDQLREAVEMLRNDPWSRRAVVTAWNPDELSAVCLPPCHILFQFSVRKYGDGRRTLDCAVTMRSVDTFLGMPFDIASYALLTHLAAWELGLEPGVLTMWFGDTHVYLNHVDQCREMLDREPKDLPVLVLAPPGLVERPLDQFEPSWASLDGYDPWPSIKADMNP
jgi:thymidylate synthase